MRLFQKSKTKKLLVGFFFAFIIFSGFIFFLGDAQPVHAQSSAQVAPGTFWSWTGITPPSWLKAAYGVGEDGLPSGSGSCDILCAPFKWIMYAILLILQLVASAALTLFEFIIQPGNISGSSGILNTQVVADLWKFVRDFFNLFFILILLFSAFATIFQVEQFHIRKIFLNILLAALLVNFSFPITRFLIDATNVPMYYFANALSPAGSANGGKGSAFGEILKASQLTELIVPNDALVRQTDFSKLLLGVIFMFLFAISVTVLAVMMFVRLIGLTILLIFSSVGFVAGAFPGLQKFGSQWWDKFWSYALFGPAALLMLFVSIKLMAALTQTTSGIGATVKGVSQNIVANQADGTLITAMVLFAIPIILIWFTIGIASSFSIAGAGAVTGFVQKWANKGAKWTGKKVFWNPAVRGTAKGLQQRFNENKLVKWATGPSATEARFKGVVGTGSAKKELQKLHEQEVKHLVDEMKKEKTSHSSAVEQMKSKDHAEAQAAAMYLAQNDDIRNSAEFNAGLAAVKGNEEFTSEFVKKSKDAIQSFGDLSSALAALGSDTKTAGSVIDKINPGALPSSGVEYDSLRTSTPFAANPGLEKQLASKLKKEGKIEAKIDYEVNVATGTARKTAAAAVHDALNDMGAEDIAKQDGLFNSTNPAYQTEARAFMTRTATADPQIYQEIKNKMKSKTSALFP